MREPKSSPEVRDGSAALWVSLAYGVISALWILVSDRFLAHLVTDPGQLTEYQIYKSWLFIAMTPALLYLLLRFHTAFAPGAALHAARHITPRRRRGCSSLWVVAAALPIAGLLAYTYYSDAYERYRLAAAVALAIVLGVALLVVLLADRFSAGSATGEPLPGESAVAIGWSLRHQLLLLVLAVTLPLAVLVSINLHSSIRQAEASGYLTVREAAQQLKSSSEQFLAESRHRLELMAARPLVKAMDPNRCDPFIGEFRQLFPEYANFALRDLDGRLVCGDLSRPGQDPVSVANFEWFREGKRRADFTVGKAFFGQVTMKWVSVLTYPVRDALHRVVGLLVLPIDLEYFQRQVKQDLLPRGSTVALVDDEGTFIMHSANPGRVGKNFRGKEIVDLVLRGERGEAKAAGIDAIERIYSFDTIADAGWHVFAGIPTDIVTAGSRATAIQGGAIGAMFLLVIAGLAFLISQWIAAPLRALGGVAVKIARGNRDARATPAGNREIAQVAAQFNAMLDALVASERQFRDTLDNVHLIAVSLDLQGNVTYCNDYLLELSGWRREELLGRNWFDTALPDPAPVRAVFERAIIEGDLPLHQDGEILTRAGERRWIHWNNTVVRDPANRILGTVNLGEDITERRAATEALRMSEQKFSTIFHCSPAPIGIGETASGRLIDVNESYAKFFGYQREELIGRSAVSLWADPTKREAVIAELADKGYFRHVELEFVRKTGEIRWGLLSMEAAPIGEVPTLIAMIVDIDERKQAEERLLEREHRLAESQRIAHIGGWSWDLEGAINWTDETYRIYGVSAETYTPTVERLVNLIHPEDRPRMQRWIAACTAGLAPGELEFRAVTPDGSVRILSGRGELQYGADRLPLRVVGTVQDITEHKRTEIALREIEEQLRLAVDSGSVGLWEWHITTGKLVWSDRLKSIFGLSPDTTGLTLDKFIAAIHPEDRAETERKFRKALKDKDVFNHEYRILWPDGTVRWIVTTGRGDYSVTGEPLRMLGAGLDVTERRQAEEALRMKEIEVRAMAEHSPIGIFMSDPSGKRTFRNLALRELTGLTLEQAQGDGWLSALNPEDRERVSTAWKDFVAGASAAYDVEYRFLNRTQRERLVHSRAVAMHVDNRLLGFTGTVENVTERKQAAARVNRLTSLYAAAYETGSALLRVREPKKVLHAACQIVVAHGGLALAWIALAGDSGGRVDIASHFGAGGDELREIAISTDAALPEGRGPTGTAIRENRQCIVNDLTADPQRQPAHEFVLRHGFRSLAATPIVSGGRPIGALSVCAVERDFFDEEAASLLRLVASDIGFVFDLIETESVARRHAEQLEQLSRRVLSMLEQERAAIARELHDEIGQVLTALKLQAQGLAREVKGPVGERIARGIPILDQAIAQTRSLALDLRPPQLDHLGLVATLRDTLIRVAEPAGLKTRLVTNREDLALDKPLATAVYRVAQEAITNVVRHATAKEVLVELQTVGAELQLAVSDDGRGYDLDAALARAVQGESMGLIGMQERAVLAGGTLKIITHPGEGTRVEARFPLSSPSPPADEVLK